MNTPSQPNPDNPISELEKAAWAVTSEPLDFNAIDRVKTFAKQLSENSESAPASKEKVERASSQKIWASSPRTKWLVRTALAAAAFVLIGSFFFFLGAQKSAFAEALEKLQQVKAFSFEQTVYSKKLNEPTKVKVLVSEDGRQRHEQPGSVSIMDSNGMMRLHLSDITKTAIVHDAVPGLAGVDQLSWFETLKNYKSGERKDLGEKEVDGRTISGTELEIGTHQLNVWVDTESNELYLVEHFFNENHPVQKSISTKFDFDVTVDDSLFSFDIPEGYNESDVDTSFIQSAVMHPEKNIAIALRAFAEASEGKFPKSLENWGDWMPAMMKTGKPNKELAGRVGAMTPFFSGLNSSDYKYRGADLKLDQEKLEIVFWFRKKDGSIQAIYTDLSLGEIGEEDLGE